MKKKENTTKRQHYVPQVLIKNFYNNSNRVNAYLLKDGTIFSSTSRDICHKKYLYEYDKDNHLNEIEKEFNPIEGKLGDSFRNIFKQLNNIDIKNSEGCLVPINEDIKFICRYLIIQLLRTPNIIKNLNIIMFKTYVKFIIDVVSSESEKVRDLNLKEQVEELLEEVDDELDDQEYLSLKGEGLLALFKEESVIDKFYDSIVKTHNIVIFRSERLHFLSSDEPVVIHIQSNDFMNSDYFLSLNPHYCLGLIKSDELLGDKFIFKKVTYKEYETITKLLIAMSNQLVFSDEISDKVKNIINEVQQKSIKDTIM